MPDTDETFWKDHADYVKLLVEALDTSSEVRRVVRMQRHDLKVTLYDGRSFDIMILHNKRVK